EAEGGDDAGYAVQRGLRRGGFVLFEPGFDLREYLRSVGVPPQDLEPARLEVSVGGLEVREFSAAGAAPGPPEVDQHIFASEFRQPALLAIEIGELEIGRLGAHL